MFVVVKKRWINNTVLFECFEYRINYYVGFYFWILQQEILYKGLNLKEHYSALPLYLPDGSLYPYN